MDQKTKPFNPILALLVLILAATLLAALLFPILATADTRRGYTAQVTSALKQIATANLIYNHDFDETFPPAQSQITYRTLINPYIKNPAMFTIGQEEHGTDIRFNTRLANVHKTSIDAPHQAIMLHTFFHQKSRNPSSMIITAHADTSAKSLSPEEWPDFHTTLDRLYPRVSEDFYPIDATPQRLD